MATDTNNGGGGSGGNNGMPPGVRTFVPPSFYRTPFFPYANLPAQLQDALGLAGRGAGGFTNMASPLMQNIRGGAANVGGGLLGKSAYSFGPNPFMRSNQGGGSVIPPNPGGTFGPPPGAPPGGTGYAPPGFGSGGGGFIPGGPPPGGSNMGPGTPPSGPPQNGSSPGTGQYPGLLGGGGNAPGAPGAKAAAGGPGGPTSDPKALADMFMATDPQYRGNFFNAVSQYGLGKGGSAPGGLGGALQAELRNRMGQGEFSNWLTGMDNKQGSTVGREGLPSWLISALGG